MKRVFGFMFFMIAVGMILMLFISNYFLAVLLIILLLIIGYNLFIC